MTSPRPSRLVQWCLRTLMPRAEADAVVGDLHEEVRAREREPGAEPSSAWRTELRAWGYVAAMVPAFVRLLGRSLWHIVRDAARSLRAAPGAAAGIVLILTLSISAATVTFSVVDTVVLRPLPFDDDHTLVVVELGNTMEPRSRGGALSLFQYLTLREQLTSVDSLAAVASDGGMTLNSGGAPERLSSVQVTASLFDALRARPFIGETFTAEHEVDGNQRVAVISYDLWQRRFGGDPGIVGQTTTITKTMILGGATIEEPLTVLGVMPRGFAYPMSRQPLPDVWTPYVMPADERTGVQPSRYLHVIGRLRSGESFDRAQIEAMAVTTSLGAAEPEFYRTRRLVVVPLKETLVGNVRGWMLLVLGAVTIVMLIACVNVANLQLVRATRRARELSIRAALGATRRQLVAALLVESLLLSLIAATLAIVSAVWGIQAAKAALPADLVRLTEIGLDLRVLTATIASAVVTGVLFGMVPAWQASREDLLGLLKQSAMTMGIGRRRWRAAFVIAEVAFVSVLLVGATLIISSFIRVTTADLGFDRSNLLVVSDTGAEGTADAIDRLRSLPGVVAVGAVAQGSPPLVAAGFRSGGSSATSIRAADNPPGNEPIITEFRRVSSGYFAAAGIPIVRGRVYDDSNVARETAIVIDETLAEVLFGQREAVGAELIWGNAYRRTVVAVARNVRLHGPERTSNPQVYLPSTTGFGGSDLLVRTSAPPETVIPAIRAAFPSAATSGNAVLQIRPLEDAFRNITADRRFNATVMAIFGTIAIVIGAVGIYGVLASVVAQQTREMAVRVALGATTGRIVASVVTQAGRYLIAGLAIGLAVAWWASQSIAAILYGVQPTDASVYATVAAVMIAVGVLAACIPAWRASRVDPLVALRTE